MIVAGVVRKAFKVSEAEKPGGAFISLPENIASMEVSAEQLPLKVQAPTPASPSMHKVIKAAQLIDAARFPMIMVGNGAVRNRAHKELLAFGEKLNIPVGQTFMAK